MDTHLIGKAKTLLLVVLAFYRTETLPVTGGTTAGTMGGMEMAEAAVLQTSCDIVNFANLFCAISNLV
jgi:hypothetical protein